jgi:hypothetical protein
MYVYIIIDQYVLLVFSHGYRLRYCTCCMCGLKGRSPFRDIMFDKSMEYKTRKNDKRITGMCLGSQSSHISNYY